MTKQAAQTPQKTKPEKGKNKSLKNVAYIVLVILLLALAAGGAYARYVYKNANSNTVLAREFYFTSDQLSSAGATYTLNPGTTSVTFNLKNHADMFRFSSDNIGYTVTVQEEGSTEPPLEVVNDFIAKGEQDPALITINDLEDGKTYTVTAVGRGYYTNNNDEYITNSDGGYQETLKATFTVLSAGTGVYKHLDTSNSAYVVLTVWTENVTGDVTIAFPAGLIPDATDPVLDDITNYSNSTYASGTFVDEKNKADEGEGSFASPYSSRTYRFFKTTSTASITETVFEVTLKVNEEQTIIAVPATP